jgi:two-component system, NarL family, response regulator NreC
LLLISISKYNSKITNISGRGVEKGGDMETRILIADDHKLFCEGLRALLEKHPGMEVIAEAEDGRTAVRLSRKLMPDMVIMDIAMPELNGIEATRQIVTDMPNIKVIALSMHSDKNFVIEIIKAGASGYVLKNCVFTELTDAVKAVANNRTYLSHLITDVVVKDFIRGPEKEDSAFGVLTYREKEVLQLIAEGNSTKTIASSLNLSTKTVETYRKRIMTKLNIYNIAGLTKYAIKEGISYI